MRIRRSIQALTLVTTVAALTACGSMGGRHQPDDSVVAVQQWDSGPLDRSYQGEKKDMDARHQQEIANPRAGESSDQANRRQSSESKDLEDRYAQGKTSHAQTMPASKQDDHADKPGN